MGDVTIRISAESAEALARIKAFTQQVDQTFKTIRAGDPVLQGSAIQIKGLGEAQAAATRTSTAWSQALGQIPGPLGDVASRTSSWITILKGPGGLVAGLGAAAVAAVAMTKAAADTGEAFARLAQRTDVPVETLSSLKGAAALANLSLDDLGDALGKLQRAMSEAGTGHKEFTQLFRDLGVSIRDASGRLRPTEAVLEDVAGAIGRLGSSADRERVTLELFGRGAAGMIPFLQDLRDRGLRGVREEAERLGQVWSTETAQAAARFNDDLTRLTGTAGALALTVGQSLLPVLQGLVGMLAQGFGVETRTLTEQLTEIEARITSLRGRFGEAQLHAGLGPESREFTRLLEERDRLRQQLQMRFRELERAGAEPPLTLTDPKALAAAEEAARKLLEFRLALARKAGEAQRQEFERTQQESFKAELELLDRQQATRTTEIVGGWEETTSAVEAAIRRGFGERVVREAAAATAELERLFTLPAAAGGQGLRQTIEGLERVADALRQFGTGQEGLRALQDVTAQIERLRSQQVREAIENLEALFTLGPTAGGIGPEEFLAGLARQLPELTVRAQESREAAQQLVAVLERMSRIEVTGSVERLAQRGVPAVQSLQNQFDTLNDEVLRDLQNNFSDFFEMVLTGTGDVGAAFTSLGETIQRSFADVLSRGLVKDLQSLSATGGLAEGGLFGSLKLFGEQLLQSEGDVVDALEGLAAASKEAAQAMIATAGALGQFAGQQFGRALGGSEKNVSTGAAIGSGVGGAVGSVFGPGWGAVGAFAGGFIGGGQGAFLEAVGILSKPDKLKPLRTAIRAEFEDAAKEGFSAGILTAMQTGNVEAGFGTFKESLERAAIQGLIDAFAQQVIVRTALEPLVGELAQVLGRGLGPEQIVEVMAPALERFRGNIEGMRPLFTAFASAMSDLFPGFSNMARDSERIAASTRDTTRSVADAVRPTTQMVLAQEEIAGTLMPAQIAAWDAVLLRTDAVQARLDQIASTEITVPVNYRQGSLPPPTARGDFFHGGWVGEVPGYAPGGWVHDGLWDRDSVLAALARNEFVVNNRVTRQAGAAEFLEDFNTRGMPAVLARAGAVPVMVGDPEDQALMREQNAMLRQMVAGQAELIRALQQRLRRAGSPLA